MASISSNLKTRWKHLVWNKISVPNHRFVCWLAAKKRLRTKDKLLSLGVVKDDLCPLCDLHSKTTKHVSFECSFSVRCIAAVRCWVGISFCVIDKMDFRKSRKNQLKRSLLCAIYAATIYHIWMNRNVAIWKGYVRSPQQVLCTIRLTVRDCFEALYPNYTNSKIRVWL